MKKNILISFIALAVLVGAGVWYVMNKSLEAPVPPFVEPIESEEVQQARFYMGHAMITPFGINPVLNTDAATIYMINGRPVYVNEQSVESIMMQSGGLPDCYIGNPKIVVDANVRVAINDVSTPTHYVVTPEYIRSVSLDVQPCAGK